MCAGPDPAGRSRLDRGSTAPRRCATVQSPDAPSRTEMLGWMNHHTCCRARSGTSISAPVRLRLAGTDTWATVSALATGFGTLVLAVATFAAVRSANRAARAAERSLLAGLRPLLVPSHPEDGAQKVFFSDDWHAMVPGGGAVARVGENDENCGVVYLATSLRNAGNGIGVLHGWLFYPGDYRSNEHPDPGTFARQTRDLIHNWNVDWPDPR